MAATSSELSITTVNNNKLVMGNNSIYFSINHDEKRRVSISSKIWKSSNHYAKSARSLSDWVFLHHSMIINNENHMMKICIKVDDLAACLQVEPEEIEYAHLQNDLKEFIINALKELIKKNSHNKSKIIKIRSKLLSIFKNKESKIAYLPLSSSSRPSTILKDNIERILCANYHIFQFTHEEFCRVADNFYKLKPLLTQEPSHHSKRKTLLTRSFVYYPAQDEMYILLKNKTLHVEDIGIGSFNRVTYAISLSGQIKGYKSAKKDDIPPKELKINAILQNEPDYFIVGNAVEYQGHWRKRDAKNQKQQYVEKIGSIVDFKPEGDLFFKINDLIAFDTTNLVALNIASQITKCLVILHEKYSIVHLDLKPENILLDETWHAYLTDFGLSAFVDDVISPCGSAGYIDPYMYVEAQSDEGLKANTSQDIWSLGIIFYLIYTYSRVPKSCKSLYETNFFTTSEEDFEKLKTEQLLEKENIGSMDWIIDQCLQINPTKRPKAGEILTFINTLIAKSCIS